MRINPHLGDLEYAKGSFPTKYGVLRVSHTRRVNGTLASEVIAPEGLTVIQGE